jgi:hypothetical protein
MPFRVPEYESAFRRFVERTVDALAEADPILGQVQRVKSSGPLDFAPAQPGPTRRDSMGRDSTEQQVVEAQLIGAELAGEIQSLLDTDVGAFQASVAAAAEGYIREAKALMYAEISRAAQAEGNVVDLGGEPLNWDRVLDMYEQVRWGAQRQFRQVRQPFGQRRARERFCRQLFSCCRSQSRTPS